MTAKKTLQQRERESQSLVATSAGRKELEELEARYQAAGGKVRPGRASVITCILVHERVQGLLTS